MKKISLVLALSLLIISALSLSCKEKIDDRLLSVDKDGRTVVERFGQLRVEGPHLVDQNGRIIQLRGMSSNGLQWQGRFANERVMRRLRDDWNIQVWRSALYLREGGYMTQRSLKNIMEESIQAAIDLGIYILIDWHIHSERDPNVYKDEALVFFAEMAQKYGSYPNILYEICNEPKGDDVTWNNHIKPYAEEVIAEIRKYDPNNIIIVGTPTWSQDVDIAAQNPLEGENIMYTLHFYAGTHGKAIMDKADTAYKMGLPIFVTECGTTQSNGGNGVFEKEFTEWVIFLKKRQISWINWSVSDRGDDSGILRINSDRLGTGEWTDDQLTQSGRFIRKMLKNEIRIKN